ncbi:hypothetical protein AAFN46_13495 [Pseudomonas sp. CAU 1711]|uniref:hypothetical protein n=1 Tax=Pseudomonas sp. CAU 1711 TaxID=3140356 RepID=UPI0032603144
MSIRIGQLAAEVNLRSESLSKEQPMSAREEQFTYLLGLMARSTTSMTASVTAKAFEQLRCKDEALQAPARQMIERMQAISEELDH